MLLWFQVPGAMFQVFFTWNLRPGAWNVITTLVLLLIDRSCRSMDIARSARRRSSLCFRLSTNRRRNDISFPQFWSDRAGRFSLPGRLRSWSRAVRHRSALPRLPGTIHPQGQSPGRRSASWNCPMQMWNRSRSRRHNRIDIRRLETIFLRRHKEAFYWS